MNPSDIRFFKILVAAILGGISLLGLVMTTFPRPELQTIEHDGHRWIVRGQGGRRDQPTHHPDCPCLKELP